MQDITSVAELRKAIQLLEEEELIKRQLLKDHLKITFESLRPINLLKNTLKDISASPELIDNIIGNVAGLASGFLSNKLIVGSSGNVFRKIIGAIVQLGVSGFVARHSDAIKSFGQSILHYLLRKKETHSENGGNKN
jgi:hypothetical protein